VPFRAAHLPSERSEYAQPDTALSLTTLAYYHDGLSKQQLEDALHVLLDLGPSSQQAHYSEWLELAGDGIPAGTPSLMAPSKHCYQLLLAAACWLYTVYG
jgi:hypothetical protein